MKKLFSILFISTLAISCTDNYLNEYDVYPGLELNDVSWSTSPIDLSKTNALINDLVLETKTYNFNAATGATWNLNENIQIILPANAYTTVGGLSITGNVSADFITLQKKGDYIRNLLPSITSTAIIENSNTSFYIALRGNGINEAKLQPGRFITINLKDSTAIASQQLAFTETVVPLNNDNPIRWITNNTSSNGSLQILNNLPITAPGSKMGFSIQTNKTSNYITASKIYTPPNTTSRIDVVMPVNFTNKNTIVFAAFVNKNIVLRLTPDPISKSYFFNSIPTSENLCLVSVSVIDNKIYYGLNKVVATPNGVFTLKPNTDPITKIQLKYYLSLL